MNFNVVYNASLDKVAREAGEIKSKKGFSILESKILGTPALVKQYNIFAALKEAKRGMSQDDAQALILFVERYCSKLNYTELAKANKEMLKFFNIDTKATGKASELDEAIDDLIRITTGGTILLTEGTKYRKVILDYLTTEPKESIDNIKESKDTILTALGNSEIVLESLIESIGKAYEGMSKAEREVVEIVRSNNPMKLETKLQMVECMAKRISVKEKSEMLSTCAAELRNKLKTESLDKLIPQVYELRKTAIGLLENDRFGGGFVKRFKDLNYIKNIKFGVDSGRNRPEVVIVNFSVFLYPLAATYMDYNRAAKDLDKRLNRVGRTVINSTIFHSENSAKQFFTGECIWEANVRSEGLKPGQKVPGNVEWWLYTVQDPANPRAVEAFEAPAYQMLKELDAAIVGWLPEIDPKSQQEFMSMLSEPTNKIKAPKGGEESGEEDDFYKDEPEASVEKEPSDKDIKGVSSISGFEDLPDEDNDEL